MGKIIKLFFAAAIASVIWFAAWIVGILIGFFVPEFVVALQRFVNHFLQ